MDIENLEAAVFIREYEVERQLRYKMSHGDHRCRYGHFFVTDRPLWVGQFSEISGNNIRISLYCFSFLITKIKKIART